jgi:membrane protein YdbS with pleckstrin-like domain
MQKRYTQTKSMTEKYTFRGKRSDEQVLMVVRQHPWVLMPIFWVWLGLIAIIVLSIWQFGLSTISSYVIFSALGFGLLYSLYQWFVWNNSNYIITSQRVIKIDQNGLFNREISEAEIGRIQEISTEIKGPIRTLFNFGRVKIQTASSYGRVDLEDVADPYDIQQEIVRVKRSLKE